MIDVAVLGGGLAGLTFARELAMRRPGTSITVFESNEHPPPVATHKVGESCVEIAGHWFVNVLGLGAHLEEEHLPKLGLRFFFGHGPIEERVELGPILNRVQVPFEGLLLPSYQLDRGVLERFLAEDMERLGVRFQDRSRVRDIQIGDPHHRITVEVGGKLHEIQARYVLDGTGRAALLKKRLGLRRSSPHVGHSAWFRVDGHLKVDDWAPADSWQRTMKEQVRWRSTCHLMGEGYWVWFIPLSTGHMSIGIVFGGDTHAFSEIHNFEAAMDWMERFEPQAAAKIREHLQGAAPLDFLVSRQFPVDATRIYSADRWGLLGEAGAFVDPLYSPGSDFLAMVNRGHVDLVCRCLDGEDIAERVERTEAWFRVIYDMFLRVYHGLYPVLGNTQVMSAKILFDTAFYWGWPTLLVRNDAMMDIDYIDGLGDIVPRMIAVQTAAQRFFKDWNELENPLTEGSIDQFDVGTLWRIYVSLVRTVGPERLTERLTTNLLRVEALLEVLFRHAARGFPEVVAAERINVQKLSFDPSRWQADGLFDGPDRAEEVERVQRECMALWVHAS